MTPPSAGGVAGVLDILRDAAREGRYERDRVAPFGADEWQSEVDSAIAAVAELIAKAEKVAGWLDAQATAAQGCAQDTRFPSLAEANAADARNYRAIAKDLRAALAPFQTGGAE